MMASPSLNKFPHFADLPPELRIQIWQHALPKDILPALHMYKPGCWKPYLLSVDHPDYLHSGPQDNWMLHFQHDQLAGGTRLRMALLSVNSEAREVALAWAAKHPSIEIHGESDSNGQPILLCRFDPKRDCMYVCPKDWDDFLREENQLPFELGWDDLGYSFSFECHRLKLAVPKEIFTQRDQSWRGLEDLLGSFSALRALCVVADEMPSIPALPHGWRCEIDSKSGAKICWDYGNTEWHQQGHPSEERQLPFEDEMLWQAARELQSGLIFWQTEKFSVRKVSLSKDYSEEAGA